MGYRNVAKVAAASLGDNGNIQKAIDEAKGYADKYIPKDLGSKVRDAYGIDNDGKYQRCEGGVLIAMPAAGGGYYASNCLKAHAPRLDLHRPDHVKDAFFLVRKNIDEAHNRRIATTSGDVFVMCWDRPNKYDDNKGYYLVHIMVTRKD